MFDWRTMVGGARYPFLSAGCTIRGRSRAGFDSVITWEWLPGRSGHPGYVGNRARNAVVSAWPRPRDVDDGGSTEARTTLHISVNIGSFLHRRLINARQQARYVIGRWPVLLHDGLMISLSWYLAYWLRFNLGTVPDVFLVEAAKLLPLVIICHLGTSAVLGVPRGAWRFTSLYDLTKVTQGVVFGTAIVAALVFTYDRMWAVPRSVFLLQ